MVICGSRHYEDDGRILLKSTEQLNNEKQGTAFQHIRDNIEDLNGRVGACDTDLIFLKGLMDSPVMSSLIKVQDRLEESNGAIKPMGSNTSELLLSVRSMCRHGDNKVAHELAEVLENPHIQALLEAHDLVAVKQYQVPEMSESPSPEPSPTDALTDAVRMVGIRKNDEEPLGITVKNEEDNLVIARILAGGIIDRQGLLHVGDVIMEVNGVEVHSPEQLQKQLQRASGSINFKIMSAYQDSIPSSRFYVKTLYSYDPSKDSLLPCKEIGLSFKQGEILQILNQEDPNWWQARKVDSLGLTGLVPSQELEERRRAFVRPEYDYATKSTMCGTKITKKKRKTMYHTKGNAEYDKAELTLYEEVARMPPFERKSIILIGAQGVGRRSLKNRLISSNPSRFASPLPHTSRPKRDGEQDGKNYFFVSREVIEADIAENRYLEWGEYGEHIYGTKLDSIRAIIRSGKMCIMDCNPQSLKLLKTPEFMPYIIFISAPHAELLKQMHFYGRNHGYTSNRSLTFIRELAVEVFSELGSNTGYIFQKLKFDRAMGRHGSRRARTLESLASLYEDEDLKNTIEESSRLQRAYEKHFDLTLVNNNFDKTYEQLREAIDTLSTSYQWVPVSWVY